MQKERFTYILEKLDQKGKVYVSDLCRELHVSEMTIRSDLNALNSLGLLKRTHGGAEQIGEHLYKGDIRENLYRNAGSKIAIAKTACVQITDGARIFVDDSSTCIYLIQQLKKDPSRRVTLYTNSVLIAAELLDIPHIRLHLVGGEMTGNLGSTSGSDTEQSIASISADLCFFGCNGISLEHGASVIGYPQMKVKQAMLRSCRKNILLADSHKFGLDYLSVICPLSEIDCIITDRELPDEMLFAFRQRVHILTA